MSQNLLLTKVTSKFGTALFGVNSNVVSVLPIKTTITSSMTFKEKK